MGDSLLGCVGGLTAGWYAGITLPPLAYSGLIAGCKPASFFSHVAVGFVICGCSICCCFGALGAPLG